MPEGVLGTSTQHLNNFPIYLFFKFKKKEKRYLCFAHLLSHMWQGNLVPTPQFEDMKSLVVIICT
jgi:hypothetical protein